MLSYVRRGEVSLALGKLREAKEFFTKAYNVVSHIYHAAHTEIDTVNISALCFKIGDICMDNGELAEAEAYYSRAVSYLEGANYIQARRLIFIAYQRLGNLKYDTGKLDEAESYYNKCLEITKDIADETKLTDDIIKYSCCYIIIAGLFQRQGKYDEALDCLKKNLEISLELVRNNSNDIEAQRNLAVSYRYLGMASMLGGKYTDAQRYYENELAIFKSLVVLTGSLDDRQNMANCYESIGKSLNSQGKPKEAEEFFSEAHELRSKIANSSGVGGTHKDSFSGLYNLGYSALRNESISTAERFFDDAMAVNREHSEGLGTLRNRLNNIDVLGGLAATALSQGNIQQARAYYEGRVIAGRKLVEEFNTIDTKKKLIQCIDVMIKFEDDHKESDSPSKIRSLCEEGIAILGELSDTTGSLADILSFIISCANAGTRLNGYGMKEEAEKFFMRGIERGESLINDVRTAKYVRLPLSRCYGGMVIIYRESGNLSEAIKFVEHIVVAMRSILDEPFNADNLMEYDLFIASSSLLCELLKDESEFPKAKALLLDMLKILEPLNALVKTPANQKTLAEVYSNLGEIALSEGDFEKAYEYYSKVSDDVK